MKTAQLNSLTISTQVFEQIHVKGVELKNKHSQKTHQKLIIRGPLGEQSLITPNFIKVTMRDNSFILHETTQTLNAPNLRSKKWTYEVLAKLLISQINQMVIGVTEGFKKQIKLVGIGYKIVATSSNTLTLTIGFSHPIVIEIPANVVLNASACAPLLGARADYKVDQSLIELSSTSLIDLNNFIYSIKRIRPIEKSFKGTGITIL